MRIPFKIGLAAAVVAMAMMPLSAHAASKKTKTLLGIAAGVAVGAILLNEAAKANNKKQHHNGNHHHHKKKHYKHQKAQQKKAWSGKVHCHANGKKHYHNEFKGAYWHAHEPEEGCGSYRLNAKYDDGPGTGGYKPKNTNNEHHGNAWQKCQEKFSSFRDDGTYQPWGDGPRKVCPYL